MWVILEILQRKIKMSICQLKNGSEADNKLVQNVMLIIHTLGENNKTAFIELFKLANNTTYKLQNTDQIKTTLYDFKLVDSNNVIDPEVRNIVLSAVNKTNEGTFRIDNPIIELLGDEE
jgi:hypothetical protein